MHIKILTHEIYHNPGILDVFEREVNRYLKDYPGSSVTWLQSSHQAGASRHVHLTAIITIPDPE